MIIENLKQTYKFIHHNLKNFKIKDYNNKNIILVELYDYKPSTIPFSYLSNVLSEKHEAKIVCYQPYFLNFIQKTKYFFNQYNPFGINEIYKSFGVKKFVSPQISFTTAEKEDYERIIKKIKNKKDILDIKIDNILLGDLIYDEFLRSKNTITINANSSEFKSFLKDAISLYYYWKNFFKKDKIKAVLISHHVYFMGIVPRIAIYKNIPVYTVGIAETPKYLSKKYPIKHCGFEDYFKIFKNFKPSLQKNLLLDAKKSLNERFLGKKDIKILLDRYTEKDFYNQKITKKKILSKTKKFKVLIAAHQFNDAVHVYGKFLFTDFYEWLDFLGKCTNKTNYEWYIKFHPSEYKSNYKYIKYFAKKYPKFNVLPIDVTNNQLIEEKINIILTVYGSIGHEYPLFGIPVVNASKTGPHKLFNFNIYPRDMKHYKKIITNLDKVPLVKIKKIQKNLHIYYLMRFLMEYSLIDGFKDKIIKFGPNYPKKIYEIFLKQFSKKRNKMIIKVYKDYVNSKKFRVYGNNLSKKCKLIRYG